MKTTLPLAESLKSIITRPPGGIVELVDELLSLCGEHGIRLDWKGNRCGFKTPQSNVETVLEVLVPKSVFRAILARVAVLCNNHKADAVSSYGGKSEILLGSKPRSLYQVDFLNTADEQHLQLAPSDTLSEKSFSSITQDRENDSGRLA